MKRIIPFISAALLMVATGCATATKPGATIYCPSDAPANVKLAAKEIRRYVYLRTGELLAIQSPSSSSSPVSSIVLKTDPALGTQEYRLRGGGGKPLEISGGSDVAVLYGAYAFAEKLGVRFSLHCDVIPDGKIPLRIPQLDEMHKPVFATRGIQPFHDFFEGPDWWNTDDYKAYLSQMAKMKMNFIGFHCYPRIGLPWDGQEPLVWTGVAGDFDPANGHVKFSFPTAWANTQRRTWGSEPGKTDDFGFGAAQIFEDSVHCADVMRGLTPMPKTPKESNEMFNRAGDMMRDVFTYAHRSGIKAWVGLELPLWIPPELRDRLKAQGKNPDSLAVRTEIFDGIFRRIKAAYPADGFWFWTGERPDAAATVKEELLAAHGAMAKLPAPLPMGQAGWGDLARHFPDLHKSLPKDVTLACINAWLGFAPVAPQFGGLGDRPRFAIPWMEDDTNMTNTQLFVGRVRMDAADAKRYGCNGLLGIHWRTRAIAPNLAALAQCGWVEVPVAIPLFNGGNVADYAGNTIASTATPRIYQTCRWDDFSYRIPLPEGDYNMTLQFCEVCYEKAGQRVFDVLLNGKTVLSAMDVCAEAGKNRALDKVVRNISPQNGAIAVSFARKTDNPFLAGIVITDAKTGVRIKTIDCGGEEENKYAADITGTEGQIDHFVTFKNRSLPSDMFYLDWCAAEFGSGAGPATAKFFTRMDGRLPRPSCWCLDGKHSFPAGPGMVGDPDPRSWEDAKKEYTFVDEFAALRPQVSGAGNLERFDYWNGQFHYMRAMGKVRCSRAVLDRAVARLSKAAAADKDAVLADALAARQQLFDDWGNMMTSLLETVSTPGEMGTVANLELHSRKSGRKLELHDAVLEKALGKPLPAIPTAYTGKPRLIVPTVRSVLARGEALKLKIITLSPSPCSAVQVRFRPLGATAWQTVPAKHLVRSTYEATLPALPDDFEYYVSAQPATGAELLWPAAAPAQPQTVINNE